MKKLVVVMLVAFATMVASPIWVRAADSTVAACKEDCKAKKKECVKAATDRAAKKKCKEDAKACKAACKTS